ncbi:MAG TPA: endonuclease [Flavobacteriaceae bacterium]
MDTSGIDIKLQTIAFYNIENLFDIYDDEQTNDDDFLPTSAKKWTKKRYDRKIYKLGSVISKIGFEASNKLPTIVGLAEVENSSVLNDLIESQDLSQCNYGFVHYDSNDERGIDVALLYDKNEFKVESSEAFSVNIETLEGEIDFTRDILLVTGILDGDRIHVVVNHWPSRRDGHEESSYKRLIAAKRVLEIIAKLKSEFEAPKIIIIGDFNDDPNNESIQFLMNNEELFNVTEPLWTKDRGSQNHDFQWNLFDQIIVSNNLLDVGQNGYHFESANIFDDKFVTQFHGKFKGQPFRTYVGKKYMGGFSDHFPVYILLKKN